MLPYRPDRFAETFRTQSGARVWKWLHEHDIQIVLKTASTLRCPAVEAIAPYLEIQFENQITSLKFRQMVGHMIRQVMEEQGYALQRSNVRTRRKPCIYGYGNVYRHAA